MLIVVSITYQKYTYYLIFRKPQQSTTNNSQPRDTWALKRNSFEIC